MSSEWMPTGYSTNTGTSYRSNSTGSKQKTSSTDPSKTVTNAFSDSVSIWGKGLLEGKSGDEMLEQTGDVVKNTAKSIMGMALSKIITLLTGGSDLPAATAASAKTTKNVANGAKMLTDLKQKSMDGLITAMDNIMTGQTPDIEKFSQELVQQAFKSLTNVDFATAKREEYVTKQEENKELLENITELNNKKLALTGNKEEKGGSKKPVVDSKTSGSKDTQQEQSSDNSGNKTSPEVENLQNQIDEKVANYNENSESIASLGEEISVLSKEAQAVSNALGNGLNDILIKGENVGNVLKEQAGNLAKEGVDLLTNMAMKHIGLLSSDQITYTAQSALDKALGIAAPPAAAAVEAGTLGFGSGLAGTLLKSGLEDTAASLGFDKSIVELIAGIGGAKAAGKTGGEIIVNFAVNKATDFLTTLGDGVVDLALGNVEDAKTVLDKGLDSLGFGEITGSDENSQEGQA